MSSLNNRLQSGPRVGKPDKGDSIYRNLFMRITQSTHYASELKNRAVIGKSVLKKHLSLTKIKFFIYLPHSKSQMKKKQLIERITKLNGEMNYSVSKSINFLVVSDQTFKMSNKSLLQEGAILDEAGPSENNICENTAENQLQNCKEFMNDRSIRLLSSSSCLGSDRKKITEELKKIAQPKPEFNNLFEFLNCKKWNLVSVSDLEYKLNLLESSTLEWHLDKGFNARNKNAAHFIATKMKRGLDEKGMHHHTFQFNNKINRYDVSKLNLGAPEGTSIFQTSQENEMAIENYVKLLSKHESNVHDQMRIPA